MTMRWPTGIDGALAFHGISRDLVTQHSGHDAIEAARDMLSAKVRRPYQLVSLATGPDWPELQVVIGDMPSRATANGTSTWPRPGRIEMPARHTPGQPRRLSLISGRVHILRLDSPWATIRADPARRRRMARACAGYAAESEALTGDFSPGKSCQVGPVQHPEDLLGWHEMAEAATMKCGAPAGSKCGATPTNLSSMRCSKTAR